MGLPRRAGLRLGEAPGLDRRSRGEPLTRGAPRLQTFRSYGSFDRVWVRARVVEGGPSREPRPEDRWWRNLAGTLSRMRGGEVASARVVVRFAGAETEARADAGGHVRTWLVPAEPPAGERLWHEGEVEIVEPGGDPSGDPSRGRRARAEVLIPSPAAAFGVISDVDDTIVRSHVGRLLRMVAEVAFRNPHTRTPFPGVAPFFRALHAGLGGPPNPVFYVSTGPWNLYDVFIRFLDLQGIPPGPVELRRWGSLVDEARHRTPRREHKLESLRRIFRTFPALPFVLIGDSGEEDPEIYRDLVHEFPRRVPAVYIRDVSPDPGRDRQIEALAEEVTAAGSALVLSEDTVAAARHAAEHGWIPGAAVDAVAAGRAAEGHGRGEAVVVEGGQERHERV